MNKARLLTFTLFTAVASGIYYSRTRIQPSPSEMENTQLSTQSPETSAPRKTTSKENVIPSGDNREVGADDQPPPNQSPPQNLRSDSQEMTGDASREKIPPPNLSGVEDARDKFLSSKAVSFGTVRVLGHRGCDLNTQGWFLSVGTPEQYDFKVSDDGETIEIQPNIPHPTGNFEFVQCANAGELTGKRVRFTAQVKAANVSEVAHLRLRGENTQRVRVVSSEQKVGGTHSWAIFSVETVVTDEVALFSFGLTFHSSGKLWMSHPRLSILERK